MDANQREICHLPTLQPQIPACRLCSRDGRGNEGPSETAQGKHGVDVAQTAVGTGQGAGPGVGVGVLEGHAEGLDGKAEEEERLGRPGAEALREELEGGADGEEGAQGQVGGEEGVRSGGEEPAGEDAGISGCACVSMSSLYIDL